MPKSKRHFIFVRSKDIKHDRPETAVNVISGCTKFHQIVRVAPLVIKSRGLACFCSACWEANYNQCRHQEYVGQFQVHQIHPLQVDTAQPESPEPDLPSPEPLLPRKEFFTRLQQKLLLYKRNFKSFLAAAQDGLRRAEDYPLPFPIMEPEFERDKVDEAAERQCPAGSAPRDHHARQTLGDGNCLVRSLSAAALGRKDFHAELRLRLVMELAVRQYNYLSAEYGQDLLAFLHASGDFSVVPTLEFQCEAVAAVANSKDMGLWHLMAAANVLGRDVHSIFPTPNVYMNRICKPDGPSSSYPLYIQWTSTHSTPLDATWTANHVVPVVKTRHYVQERDIQIDFVTVDFISIDGKVERYHAVVVPTPTFPQLPDNEFCMKCLRAKDRGSYYVSPDVDDISCVNSDFVKKSHQPTMNNRGHYFV